MRTPLGTCAGLLSAAHLTAGPRGRQAGAGVLVIHAPGILAHSRHPARRTAASHGPSPASPAVISRAVCRARARPGPAVADREGQLAMAKVATGTGPPDQAPAAVHRVGMQEMPLRAPWAKPAG